MTRLKENKLFSDPSFLFQSHCAAPSFATKFEIVSRSPNEVLESFLDPLKFLLEFSHLLNLKCATKMNSSLVWYFQIFFNHGILRKAMRQQAMVKMVLSRQFDTLLSVLITSRYSFLGDFFFGGGVLGENCSKVSKNHFQKRLLKVSLRSPCFTLFISLCQRVARYLWFFNF